MPLETRARIRGSHLRLYHQLPIDSRIPTATIALRAPFIRYVTRARHFDEIIEWHVNRETIKYTRNISG